MHTISFEKTKFVYNSDLSGVTTIINSKGDSIEIDYKSIKKFVEYNTIVEQIAKLERSIPEPE